MGEGRDNGLFIDSKASPRHATVEKAQAELRQEYGVREELRRELEFLEKGGNPLDFKFSHVASISLQSTSLTDQLAENCLTSEARGSFVLVASLNGDSAESSGRPGSCLGMEPHTADNLLFFYGDNDALIAERNGIRSKERGNVRELDDLLDGRVVVKRQEYVRRNRSRPSRDITRASSSGIVQGCLTNGNVTLASNQNLKDEESPPVDLPTVREVNASPDSRSKSSGHIANVSSQNVVHTKSDMEVETMQYQEADYPTHVNQEGKRNIADYEKSPEEEIFHDSQEEFPEKEPDAVDTMRSTRAGEKEDGSLVPPSDGTSALPNTGAENVSAVCGASCISTMDESSEQNGEKDPLELVIANGKTLVLKEDLDSNEIADKHLDELPNSMFLSDCDGKKEAVKRDPIDLHEEIVQMIEEDRIDVDVQVKVEEEVSDSRTLQNSEEPFSDVTAKKPGSLPDKDVEKLDTHLNDNSSSNHEGLHPEASPPAKCIHSSCAPSALDGVEECSEDATVADSRNREKEPVKAKSKRISKLITSHSHNVAVERRKSHWDFVLEEMEWLANDFMQERMWKMAAAAQVCRWVGSAEPVAGERRRLARSLAISVMDFWESAKTILQDGKPAVITLHGGGDASGLLKDTCRSSNMGREKLALEHINDPDASHVNRKSHLSISNYAVRFLSYDQSSGVPLQAKASTTLDRVDAVTLEAKQFLEASLFYIVDPVAMDAYGRPLESLWASNEKSDSGINHHGFDASFLVDPAKVQEADFEDDSCEMGSRYLPGAFEGRRSIKFTSKRRRNLPKLHDGMGYELKAISGMAFGNCMDGRFENPMAPASGKRDSGSLNVGCIPTKRVQTAARSRIVSPFSAGGMHMVNRTDVPSGDTSLSQDDLSSFYVGSQPKKSMEIESTDDFVKPMPLEISAVSAKSKKKKAKPPGCKTFLISKESAGLTSLGKGSAYKQRWQVDQVNYHDEKDQFKRVEGHPLEPDGNTGLQGHHAAKRLKISKQLPDNSPEFASPLTGSLPSPAASQMSGIANPNKLMKVIANHERGRKNKVLKISAGQSGEDFPWTLFEDQALVVIVHDMGPNWELVSDAINSTLQLKCIFRKPKECKERHKALMDKNTFDCSDSAEGSATSQPYPSTLPGIPKGSARQLFKRLQEPMENDILKAHFEKIMLIGQKLHSRKPKSNNQDQKQPLTPAHSSHGHALSQTCTTNISEATLTPLDLCKAAASSPDTLSPSYPVFRSSGLTLPSHQGAAAPLQPNSVGHMLQGSGGVFLGNAVPAPIWPLGQTPR